MNVDSLSYWMATNNARDNVIKNEYLDRFGIAEGLQRLAEEHSITSRTRLRAERADGRSTKPQSEQLEGARR